MQLDHRAKIAVGVAAVLLCLIFFWIGFASRPPPDTRRQQRLAENFLRLARNGRGFSVADIARMASSERLGAHLRYLAAEPHVAGQPQHERTAAYFKKQLGQLSGFKVSSKHYIVSIGESTGDSQFVLRFANGTQRRSQTQEKILSPHENRKGQVRPILSYTPAGSVSSSKVVFANYGSEADFRAVRDSVGEEALNGSIALMRYGGVGRGKKLVNAHAFGCVGGVVYSDPADGWARPGNLSDVYPQSWWLPGSGVQRGSAKLRQGDPQTPDYPSLPFVLRESFDDIAAESDPRVLAPIPGYPVGYDDAAMILEVLGGPTVGEAARGGLPLPYRVGGSFVGGASSLDLEVRTSIRQNLTAENVFAVMLGDLEPDRFVLIGNHRDAWGTGAVDATSGSATVLEVAKVLSDLHAAGWRPRRSILLCSWDVEEQGITGSWEWVEDKLPQIKEKVVAYLNVDIAVRGNHVIRPNADPLLQEAMLSVLRSLPDMRQPSITMFDRYKESWLDQGGKMTIPIGSSDYSAFLQKAGVPVLDVSSVADRNVSTYYPLYHSTYETLYAMERFIDPGFRAHAEVAVWAVEMLRLLSESWLLPYNEPRLAQEIRKMYDASTTPSQWRWPAAAAAHREAAETAWAAFGKTLAAVEATSAALRAEAAALQRKIGDGDDSVDPMAVRGLNDRRMRTLQALTDFHGLPRDRTKLNFFFASKSEEADATWTTDFPGLSDLLALAAKQPGDVLRWKQIAQHVSALAFRLESLLYQMRPGL